MHKFITILLLIAVSISITFAEEVNELAVIDQLRTQGGQVKVLTRIEVYEQGELTSTSRMNVYVGTQRKSLAVYVSEREAGQKVLMIDDKFWLFLPSSKRAMRITSMQKMMGEASVGDVASLAWSEDYQIIERYQDEQMLKLELVAARKGLSYSKVSLWVQPDTFYPVKADFYLKSGKLAKQATFELTQVNNEWMVQSLSLQDRVQKDQLTKIVYENTSPLEMKDKWFTPQFLLRATP
jgi:hypothetical protein